MHNIQSLPGVNFLEIIVYERRISVFYDKHIWTNDKIAFIFVQKLCIQDSQ